MVQAVCRKHGSDSVVVSVDAKGGVVALQGWKEASTKTVFELAEEMAQIGVVRILYTDIARDGALTGPDFATNARLVNETSLSIQASGGVASVEHIRELVPTGVEGVIVGRAIYTGAVNLSEAVSAVA
jgi:phosphoribosylformimino-5-aminoimidazole carboxamide ribotide isomerase